MPEESERTDKLSPCSSEDFNKDLSEENINIWHNASASLLAQSHIQKGDPERPRVKTLGAANAGAPIQAVVL